MVRLLKKHSLWLMLLIVGVPLALAGRSVLSSSMPFWFDNGRDMLAALDNLSKLTLIGPPSGISGIFYGPYWIWLLSLGQLVSKDPSVVTFLVATLPYFTLFPLILWQFSKYFGRKIIVVMWLLFLLGNGMTYATQLWNPHPAPLIFLALLYLIFFTDRIQKNFITYAKVLATGLTAGILINFHISFGIGVFLGTLVFFLIEFVGLIRQKTGKVAPILVQTFSTFGLLGLGVLLAFLPTLLFEARHGFHQIQALTFTFLKYGQVSDFKGITKEQILILFFNRPALLLHIKDILAYALEILTAGYVAVNIARKRLKLSTIDQRLVSLLLLLSAGILFIYLSAKNPVWDYHFIGIEIIFLFGIGFMLKKLSILLYPTLVWVIILSLGFVLSMLRTSPSTHTAADLFTKEKIVETIAADGDDTAYSVYFYNPAIYTYEYSYIFRWKYGQDVPYDPALELEGNQVVYLSIPLVEPAFYDDFINYRAPEKLYRTTQSWEMSDGSVILKRVKK